MAEHSHAEHRPPPPGEEAGFHNPEHMGVLYPEHDFVAVIDDWQQAQRAVQALKALGIAEDDIDLLDNARARALDREAMALTAKGPLTEAPSLPHWKSAHPRCDLNEDYIRRNGQWGR